MPENKAAYFKGNQKEVVSWWRPEEDAGAEIFERGLDRVIRELKENKITDVLDAACGKGRATKELSKYFRVTAVDISGAMLKIVKGLNLPSVTAIEADLAALPFKDDSFDAVVLLAAAVHLDDIDKVFREFHRILRPNGLLIFDIDNKFGAIRMLKNVLDPLFGLFDADYKAERRKRQQIFRPFSSGETAKSLNKAGFEIKKKFFMGVLIPFRLKNKLILSPALYGRLRPFAHFLERVPVKRRFATYIYFVCQK